MQSAPSPLLRAAPWLFIVIWSSGYVVAKVAAPHADPLTFLSVRYAGVIVVMGGLALAARAPWPRTPRQYLHLAVAGIAIQAGYLGGVWVAIAHGMPAGLVALIVNLQPGLTGAVGILTGERVTGRQWLGLALGFAGVMLVVSSKLGGAGGATAAGIGLAIAALISITSGTLYQKRFCPDFDLRTGQVIQFTASLIVTLPFAVATERMHLDWTPGLLGVLAWAVIVLTGGGISLLFLMIRHGAATKVTSYFYLVPPVTSVMAWLMFGEQLRGTALFGMAMTLLGVALVVRSPRPR